MVLRGGISNLFSDDSRFGRMLDTRRVEPDAVSFIEIQSAFDYWNSARGARFAPKLGEFKLDELPIGIIPNTVLVDFVGEPLDYYYRFFGTAMVTMSGLELTGKRYYADNVRGYGFANAEWFPVMIKERQPIYTVTRWIAVSGVERQTTTVRLPLSADGDAVTNGVTVNHFGT